MIDTPSKFQPPSHHYGELKGPWLEHCFYDEVVSTKAAFSCEYIPGFWTDFLVHGGNPQDIGDFLHGLGQRRCFTLVQHDDGLNCAWPGNILLFGAGGVGDIPIPLLVPTTPVDHNIRSSKLRISFQGRMSGPNDKTGVRTAMINALRGRTDFHFLGVTNHAEYISNMRDSTFVLCPRGWGRTSFRLYEALALGVIPIYIWDDKEWLPYLDILDWRRFSISIHVSKLDQLPTMIESMDAERIGQMQSYCRNIYADYFTIPGLVKQVKRYLES